MPYFTDDELVRKQQFLTLVCLGGMTEGFDYSAERAKLEWLGEKRREFGYRGGFISDGELAQLSSPS